MSFDADDRDLIRRLKKLDEAALTETFDTCQRPVYAVAWRLLGDAALAQDCMMDVFSRLLLVLRSGKGPDTHLRAYLIRSAHNRAVDMIKVRQPAVSINELSDELGVEFTSEEPDPAITVSAILDAQTVRAALLRLTADQRMVLLMKYFEDLSNEEAASALGKPVGAVKSLQHRALATMRRLLSGTGEVA
jgi:RNA polymerase sigma-70 factor, ECF subfamily